MGKYKITAKGRLALTVFSGAVCLVVMFVTAGLILGRSQQPQDLLGNPTQDVTPVDTSKPPDISEPTDTVEPEDTSKPIDTPELTDTLGLANTPEPADTSEPASTPKQTDNPNPANTTKPANTPKPTNTGKQTTKAQSGSPAAVVSGTLPPAATDIIPESSPPVTSAPEQTNKPNVPPTQYLLLFNEGSAELDDSHKQSLEEFIDEIRDLTDLIICCEGNAYLEDESLGLERAKVVAEYLRNMGVPSDYVLPISSSETAIDGGDPAEYRRVKLYFIESGSVK